MSARSFKAHGQTYALRSNQELTLEDYQRLRALAKLENSAQVMRETINSATGASATELRKMSFQLTRQEARVKAARAGLKETLL